MLSPRPKPRGVRGFDAGSTLADFFRPKENEERERPLFGVLGEFGESGSLLLPGERDEPPRLDDLLRSLFQAIDCIIESILKDDSVILIFLFFLARARGGARRACEKTSARESTAGLQRLLAKSRSGRAVSVGQAPNTRCTKGPFLSEYWKDAGPFQGHQDLLSCCRGAAPRAALRAGRRCSRCPTTRSRAR